MAKLRVEVTAEDIAQGVRNQAFECPVACALTRSGLDHPSAWPSRVYYGPFDAPNGRLTAKLPEEAAAFIAAFDDGRPVEPFAFEIEVTQ